MAHYQIFVPESTYKDQGETHPLVCAGLPDHVESADKLPIAEGEGLSPTGERGFLYAWRTSKSSKGLHYNPETQDWVPSLEVGDFPEGLFWIGFWKDSPPSERDLRKSGILFGEDVKLGNGEDWHVAIPQLLPHDLVLKSGGVLHMEPQARYQNLCLEAYRWRKFLAEGDKQIPYAEMFEFDIECLRINYRIPVEVVNYLRLIDTDSCKLIMQVAMNMGKIVDVKG